MRSGHPQSALPFGSIADILFQIIINVEASTVLSLCLLNKATYDTIKVLEPHICRWFVRLHGVDTFGSIPSLNSGTGKETALTVHTLVRSLYRHELARRLSLHIVPTVWGPFYDDDKAEMDFEAELRLARRLERGLHVLFHMADISRDVKRDPESHQKILATSSSVPDSLGVLAKLLEDYNDFDSDFTFAFPLNKGKKGTRSKGKQNHLIVPSSSPLNHEHSHTKNHLTTLLQSGYTEFEIGKRRLEFRTKHLTDKLEVDLHCTLRMLRELLERMLLRHGPKFWHRDTRNEYSVISWFILNQSPRNLAKLLLTPQNECCHYTHHMDLDAASADTSTSTSTDKCLFSHPLDEYWAAWKDTPDLSPLSAGIGPSIATSTSPISGTATGTSTSCNCNRLIRSWSVKPALFDSRGKDYDRAAERYLKEMWSQRHVGLHQAFTMGVFAAVL
ncbi:uncharacterized protein DSM5745_00376 [Aspergillus mulundensis]|uniref:Uncharacterized protein n=1 Tax=Aspergillus mulundensis TaxID=1810919 RepID=A0A3D8T3D0_9EURO|nr:Uncharacterized protein DSM5745_00376 [Aspergillus mulundensis]RDW93054.1 Uncharacterized protein DSM5745_00376 [Aspergillus mulundensis]